MSTITREFTKEQLQQIIETDHVQCGEASALARIALASLEAEAVAIVEPSDYVTAAQLVGEEPRSKAVRPLFEGALSVGQKLYAAPRLDNPFCPRCGGTGLADSGGTHPWGEPIIIPCDCTAPPAPVSVPDEMTPKQASRSYCGEVRGYRDGWNACRAAMLQGAEPVTTAYKLPPHIFRELVNRLRDTAVKYQGCQQLREQLSRTLQEVIQPVAPQQEA